LNEQGAAEGNLRYLYANRVRCAHSADELAAVRCVQLTEMLHCLCCASEQVSSRRVALKLVKVWPHAVTEWREGETQPAKFSTHECARWLANRVEGYSEGSRRQFLYKLVLGNDDTKLETSDAVAALAAVETFVDSKLPSVV
jgi:hypothetical protein